MLLVFDTDEINAHEIYRTLNPNLRKEGDELRLLFSFTPESGLESPESPCYALLRLKVERRGSALCTRLTLGPAGFCDLCCGEVSTDRR